MWKRFFDKAENEKSILNKQLNVKNLFNGMLPLHAASHREMDDSLLPECALGKEGPAPHSKRRKGNGDSDDCSSVSKRGRQKCRPLPAYQKPRPVVTKNCFVPLRALSMEGAEVCDETPYSENNLEKGRQPSNSSNF
jgi:hypothetical protein